MYAIRSYYDAGLVRPLADGIGSPQLLQIRAELGYVPQETFETGIVITSYSIHYTKLYEVSVYCQEDKGQWHESTWNGIRLIHVPVKTQGALGTIIFDLKTVLHSLKNRDLLLTLGYNTAIFNFLHWITGRQNIINMDGIESYNFV